MLLFFLSKLSDWYHQSGNQNEQREPNQESILEQPPLHKSQTGLVPQHRIHNSWNQQSQSRKAYRTHQSDDGFQIGDAERDPDSDHDCANAQDDLSQPVVAGRYNGRHHFAPEDVIGDVDLEAVGEEHCRCDAEVHHFREPESKIIKVINLEFYGAFVDLKFQKVPS